MTRSLTMAETGFATATAVRKANAAATAAESAASVTSLKAPPPLVEKQISAPVMSAKAGISNLQIYKSGFYCTLYNITLLTS